MHDRTPPTRCSAHDVLKEARSHRGRDNVRAMLLFEQAATVARDEHDLTTLADALSGIASIEHARGDSHAALFHLQEALAVRREARDPTGEASVLTNLGVIFTDLGNYNTALENLLHAAATLEGQTEPARLASVAANLALVYDELGDTHNAEKHYQQALTLAREVGHVMGEAVLSGNYGDFQRRQARFEQAEQLLLTALSLTGREGAVAAGALKNLGLIYRDRGDDHAALTAFREALSLARAVDDLDAMLEAMISEAETQLRLKRADNAQHALREAERLAEESGRNRSLAQILTLLSRALEASGEVEQALHVERRAHTAEADVLRAEADRLTRQLATQHELERAREELNSQRLRYNVERQAKEKVEREAAVRLAELERKALYDALTGLPNRLLLADRYRVAAEQAASSGTRLALGVLDLNKFKRINDTLGHHIGDELLIEVARRLEPALSPDDTVARTGGDEFVFLIRNAVDSGAVLSSVRTIMRTFDGTFHLGPHELNVRPSLGFAVYPDDALTYEELFEKADKAMYEAKTRGSGFELHGSQSSQRLAPVALERALHHALRNKELDIDYQPLTRVDGTVRGAEALLRWKHPHFGNVPPDEFLPIAEATGLSVAIGEWTLERACREAVEWEGLIVSVNFSARQFMHAELPSIIEKALQKHGLAPHLLELEVREETLARHPDRARDVLGTLKSLGVRIVIDDFGAGFTSFAALKHFPVDGVKVDRTLIHDLKPGSPGSRDEALVHAVVRMAQALNLDVIAEGVETEHQRQVLTALGVTAMQGFLYALPGLPGALRHGPGPRMR